MFGLGYVGALSSANSFVKRLSSSRYVDPFFDAPPHLDTTQPMERDTKGPVVRAGMRPYTLFPTYIMIGNLRLQQNIYHSAAVAGKKCSPLAWVEPPGGPRAPGFLFTREERGRWAGEGEGEGGGGEREYV